ncbi:tRNA-binding protein [Frankia sp. QA3]|uniref:tRNA-binding protein n=1 Tax=Frankia sp. QA3 TaxID=710111 RepID=UPI000269BE5F|nr:tRNA-binding protein [Frankia sp. QA3]EIV92361.1 export-related chaperone CsaA [Frankia sp. QA3]
MRSEKLADVSAEQFFALDIRVGQIVRVEEFPEARRPAWKLFIDFGENIGLLRTSAQVKNYSAEDLKGRLVVAAVNLGTKQVGPFLSQCLVLGAITEDGSVALLEVPKQARPGDPVA